MPSEDYREIANAYYRWNYFYGCRCCITNIIGVVMDTLLTIKGCLTPEQFTVVMLKDVKEMTYANVGDHIGKSAGNARYIHAKALLRLRRKFNGTRVRSYSN